MKTKTSFLLALAAAVLILGFGAGCKTSPRGKITTEEAVSRFTAKHGQPRQDAFNKVELALAEAFNNLPAVTVLRQPETGTFLLKPLVRYQVGGALGQTMHARYTLKIVVSDTAVALDFELGTETKYGAYAPESQIPGIKADFRSIARRVAASVGGTLE